MTKASVTRTASDALLAKWSALDAGYRPVGINGNVYGSLLQNMTVAALEREGIRQKRQSPLVNAGYAARIAATTYAVQSFLSFHNATISDESSGTPLQVVLLGCGLDILGLWALSFQRKNIKLFELDTFEIVLAKKDLLISMGWLQVTSTERDEATIVEGFIRPKMSNQDTTEESSALYPHNYTLAACDLKHVSSVETALSNLDRTVPTLVLSELVLAYLGRQGIDDLLNWCASTVCVDRGSALVAYEALGPSTHDIRSVRSVVEGYKHHYCAHFRDKLQRGIVSDDKFSDQDVFHPLGDSPGSVKKRLTVAGFPWASADLAGTVAACIFDQDKCTKQSRSLQPCEPFDEHAALALHLHSYIFLCAFPEDTDINLIRSMCPWSTTSCYDMKAKVVRVDDGSEIMIAPIEAADQCQVQELFNGTYAILSKQYPAVRKMVKTALQTDLNFSPLNETFSSIGLRYQSCGGVFLVAVEISASNTDDESRSPTRTVIGCLGIRLCDANEGTVRGGQQNTFEIHRLAVDANARGRGVGKALLASAHEDFLRCELGDDESYRLVATTPALLTTANNLYASNGFEMQKQETIGKMTINTYVKESKSPKILGTSNELT
jgi:O-methyltransferase involved in polyketide biosynthesis/GNAT superfamily N-acetyltransferase